jgi:hypothetical protein
MSRDCRLGSWDRLEGDSSESLQLFKSRCSKEGDIRIEAFSGRKKISGLLFSDRFLRFGFCVNRSLRI